MIVFCSINDRAHHLGTVYCTTMKPMAGFEYLDFLAPTKELVYGHKYHGKSDEWYIDGYRKLLAGKWAVIKPWLMSIDKDKDMTLLCYCAHGKFCHRQLMAKMIARHRPDIHIELY